MAESILALDAGTTSVRALVLSPDGSITGHAQAPFAISYPAPGLVEQDPEQMWDASLGVIQAALAEARLRPGDLHAVGIATQRSCCVLWERASGKALTPLVSWQDLRGADRAVELQGQGFLVDTQTVAAKMESILNGIDGGRARMARGELAWGNIDTLLAWRLSGGAIHVTDASQGCTTGYYDHLNGTWDASLLALQELEPGFFPRLCDTSGELGMTDAKVLGAEVLIGALIGDQQSAAVAQDCREPGEGKITYGTSGTCNVSTGSDILFVAGTYPLVLMRRGGETLLCVEGMVLTAGAVFEWLSTGLGILNAPSEAAAVASSVADTHGVYILPALQGLGTPYRDPTRHASIGGLTRGATKAHIVRAAMEGVAFRVREMVDGIYGDSGLPRPAVMRVDGGASANDVLMQIQADVLGQPVERMAPREATAFGAAVLAGQAAGLWDDDAPARLRRTDRLFEPAWSEDEREERFRTWHGACYGS